MVRYFVRHFTSGNIKKRPNYLRNILVSRTFPHDRCFLNNNQCRLRQDFFVVIILYIFLVKKLIAEGRNQLTRTSRRGHVERYFKKDVPKPVFFCFEL